MTDKVQKIKEFLIGMSGAACCDAKTKKNIETIILPFIDSLQEEPVDYDRLNTMLDDALSKETKDSWNERLDKDEEPINEDLGEYINELSKQFPEVSFAKLSRIAVRVAKWQRQQDQSTIELAEDHAMLAGIEKMKEQMTKDIWKPADGDDLPEIDREVVVFTQNFPNDAGIMCVAIAHRPNPDGWDGKSLSTGKVEHYTPKTYDKGGWNIPDVKYWLDVELPKEIEL